MHRAGRDKGLHFAIPTISYVPHKEINANMSFNKLILHDYIYFSIFTFAIIEIFHGTQPKLCQLLYQVAKILRRQSMITWQVELFFFAVTW